MVGSWELAVPDMTCMTANADIAPANTVTLECRIAMIADIKNVLSPSSDTTITDRVATNACVNPAFPCNIQHAVTICHIPRFEYSFSQVKCDTTTSYKQTHSYWQNNLVGTCFVQFGEEARCIFIP